MKSGAFQRVKLPENTMSFLLTVFAREKKVILGKSLICLNVFENACFEGFLNEKKIETFSSSAYESCEIFILHLSSSRIIDLILDLL